MAAGIILLFLSMQFFALEWYIPSIIIEFLGLFSLLHEESKLETEIKTLKKEINKVMNERMN